MEKNAWRAKACLFMAGASLLALSPIADAQTTARQGGPTKTSVQRKAVPSMLVIENGIVVAEVNILGEELVLSHPVAKTATAVAPVSKADLNPARIYDTLVQQAAWRYRLDPELLHAVIKVESNYNPMAISSKGAIGLMQIMPATGADLGFANPRRDLLIPGNNIDAGARYLAWLMQQFNGDLRLALAAYNAGIGAVSRNQALSNYPETRKYVRSVLDLYRQAGLRTLQLEAMQVYAASRR